MSQRSQSGKVSVRSATLRAATVRQHRFSAAIAGVEALEARRLLTVEQASSADGFVDSIGINTHFYINDQSDNPYDQAATLTTLENLGIRHIRDNPKNSDGDSRLQALYNAAGIRVDIAASNTGSINTGLKPYVIKDYTEAAEGLNEPENFGPYTYEGLTDNYATGNYSATRRYDDEYYNMVKANTTKPFWSTAMGAPNTGSYMAGTSFDAIATHLYPGTSSPGDFWKLDSQLLPSAREASSTANVPIIATEAGYNTATVSGTVSADAKEKYLPRMLAEYFNNGVSRTYMYEFADEHNLPAKIESNYGIINNDGTVKPVYTDLKNMISLLKEATWNTTTKTWDNIPSFTPGTLDYTLSSTSPNVQHTLLQKSNGEYDLMIWNETAFQTNPDGSPMTQTVPVTLTFNTNIASAAAFSLSSTTATQTWSHPLSLTLNVPDSVTIIRLTPGTIPVTTAAVGSPAIAGTASLSGSTYTVTGSGTDMWGTSDQFRYAYQTMAGDSDIVTHVASLSGSQAFAKAGIMVRQSLSGSSVDAGIFVTPSSGVIFQSGTSGGSLASFTHAGTTAPVWLKLSRRGDVFTGYTSTTGADGSWTQIGPTYTVAMTGSVYVGLAVSSHDVASTATATFDSTAITGPNVNGQDATPDATLVSSPIVSVAALDSVAGEPGGSLAADPGTYRFTRSGTTTAALTLNYTMSGSATSGTDYTALPGSVTIPVGASYVDVALNPLATSAIEGTETALLTLTTGAGSRVAATGHTAEVDIADYAADLIVTGITLSNPSPVDGDLVRFTATVKNIGNAPIPTGKAVNLGFYLDEGSGASLSGSTSAGIAAGATVQINSTLGHTSGQINAVAGRRLVSVFIDANSSNAPANTLSEANTRNNQFIQPYTVASSSVADAFTGQAAGSAPGTAWTTTGDGWAVKTDGGQPFLENSTTGTGTRSIKRSLGSTAWAGSWSLTFSHAWRAGGYPTQGTGQHSLSISADVLDSTGTGYRIRFSQGDSNSVSLDNSLIYIFKVTNGVEAGTPLATSAGFNAPGWTNVSGATSPIWRKVRITYDVATRRISVFADLAGNGTYQPEASAIDLTAPTSFATLGFNAEGLQNTVGPELDDIRMDLTV